MALTLWRAMASTVLEKSPPPVRKSAPRGKQKAPFSATIKSPYLNKSAPPPDLSLTLVFPTPFQTVTPRASKKSAPVPDFFGGPALGPPTRIHARGTCPPPTGPRARAHRSAAPLFAAHYARRVDRARQHGGQTAWLSESLTQQRSCCLTFQRAVRWGEHRANREAV